MLNFVDKQFIIDMENKEGVMVIDADLQGAWEFEDHLQMRWAFPRAYNIYRRFCLNGLARVGTSLLLEDGGYKIVVLFTKTHRRDTKELVIKNFNAAMDDMLRKVSSDIFVYSPVLGRADHCFTEMLNRIYKVAGSMNGIAGYNWTIYNKKGK